MYPLMLENDIIIVRKQSDCNNGDVAIVLINGDEATIKKVNKHDDYIELEAFNPYYPKRKFTKEDIENLPIEIIGIAIKIERDL